MTPYARNVYYSCMGESSSPCKVKNFLHVFQTGSGAHPVSYAVGTGNPPHTGDKAAG
jgi:hypothetical protein